MTDHVFAGDHFAFDDTAGYTFTATGDTLTIARGGRIGSNQGDGILSDAIHGPNGLTNHGDILVGARDSVTVFNYAVHFLSDDGAIVNSASGHIAGYHGAIAVEGVDDTVTNHGVVLSFGNSVVMMGVNPLLANDGDIYGTFTGATVLAAGGGTIENTGGGIIHADHIAIAVATGAGKTTVIGNAAGAVIRGEDASVMARFGGAIRLTNLGKLAGDVVSTSPGEADRVVNHGAILGRILFGEGADTYRGKGTVSGTVFGEDGSDSLSGGRRADRLDGGEGADTIAGGKGIDQLTGGGDDDVFVFNAPLAARNRDVIADFTNAVGNNDTISLENAVMKTLGAAGALKPKFFFAGAAAHDGNDHIVYDPATGVLSYDRNGSAAGGVTELATLTGKPVLAAADFLVI